jgi:hypothetical protein
MVRNDRLRIRRVFILIPVVLVAIGARSHAEGPALEPSRLSSPASWPRLHLPDPVGSYVARQALGLAWERLARIDCADLLNAFRDRAGRPLAERLRELAVDRQTYLTMVVFIDGSRETPCVKGSVAFTAPGSRVVRICVEEFKRTWQASPEQVVSRIIHEMLHTLGLGEDPPSSAEITRTVLSSCGRQ